MTASRSPMSGTRRRHLRWLGAFVAVLFALTWVGGTANATIIERDKYTQPYDVVNWDCGYPMRVVGVENHSVHIRQDKKIDGNVFVTDNYDFNETWTATDGRHFGMSANAIAKDVKGKLVGGTVYKFTYNISGSAGDDHRLVRTCLLQGPGNSCRSRTPSTSPTAPSTFSVPRSPGRTPRSTSTPARSWPRWWARTRRAT